MNELRDLAQKAERFLHTAEYALGAGDYDSCASRCYYAMFFMAEAALLTHELSAFSHRGVVSLFGEHFAKTGIFEKQMGRALNDAHDRRLVGDYGIGVAVTKDDAEDSLEAARDFVQRVKDYLDRWTEQK